MANLLIIGAGGVGSVVAHKCAQAAKESGAFDKIVLASRTLARCRAIAGSVKERLGVDLEIAEVDADNVPQLCELIRRAKSDLVCNVALPYQDLHIMDACLECGANYLDTANYEPLDTAKFEYKWQWAYDDRFREAGLTALLGSGFDPGVTNVFAAWVVKHELDEVNVLDIIDCNAGNHGQAFATNFNPEINIREVTARGRYWEHGQWVETDPLSWSMDYDFPDGIGKKKCYLMYHEELESLALHLPGLVRARFWMTFSDSYINHLKVLGNVGMTRIDPVKFHGQEIVPGRPASRSGQPGAADKGAHLHWRQAGGPERRQQKNLLHLQYLRSRGMLPRSWLPGHFLHYRRAGNDWRQDDCRRQMEKARGLEYGTV